MYWRGTVGEMAIDLLMLAASALLLVTDYANAYNGTFTTSDGSLCTWLDVRPSMNESALAVACSCKSELDQSQSYGCQYVGELYSCKAFLDDPGTILDAIARQVEGNMLLSPVAF